MDIASQIAQRLNIPVEQLVAVIFYSDHEWSEVEVYGSEVVAQSVKADCNWSEVSHHQLAELTEVPEITQNFASEVYGVRGGRIALVNGLPA